MNMNIEHQVTGYMSALMVIFGGTGDLTSRKLIPALYNLIYDQRLPKHFAIVAVGRKDMDHEQYRKEIFEQLKKHSRNKIDEALWEKLSCLIYYFKLNFTEQAGYEELGVFLRELDDTYQTRGNRLFYLAVSPEFFETIVTYLRKSGMTAGTKNSWKRLVIEKPFGKDLKTARLLNGKLREVFQEDDIYRIDHYLGKEMIQNIMVLRFCNLVFESLWSNKFIDNIQISLAEKHGVGTRGGYYEHSGAMRDMVQSHLLQIVSLIAMEAPINLTPDAIKMEKLKVLNSIESFSPKSLKNNIVFGQYGKGVIDGHPVPGYQEEVSDNSNTETFIAMKFHINNFRWAGTPFYVRTGKRMGVHAAEIVIQFKSLPDILYFSNDTEQEPNLLVIKIQPNVGVFFQFNTRDFNTDREIMSANMDTSHTSHAQGNTPEAYEKLILDVIKGESTLFASWDEVEASWMIADRIIEYGRRKKIKLPNYDAGSMGPIQSFELLARDCRKWWNI
ncbi:glucose-6-phosphate 1-dehydrogenase [Faecalicatena contorta]|uniref:Glucose-6-phosphate 1-dehydrogenase n=2 Tax=Faecalicatena contorta TaxID=39482 RepID=A0A315ZRE1_9FIRM|nr:glucose-6-phosphate 1-dehydrogenase [Faecalicatena contorta]SUQ16107.1 glucose-6-phosphate 1-dehydrogenase [Faecalicatena contorta]